MMLLAPYYLNVALGSETDTYFLHSNFLRLLVKKIKESIHLAQRVAFGDMTAVVVFSTKKPLCQVEKINTDVRIFAHY